MRYSKDTAPIEDMRALVERRSALQMYRLVPDGVMMDRSGGASHLMQCLG
jgi:hypothetical protein